jgi:hypothetical protein
MQNMAFLDWCHTNSVQPRNLKSLIYVMRELQDWGRRQQQSGAKITRSLVLRPSISPIEIDQLIHAFISPEHRARRHTITSEIEDREARYLYRLTRQVQQGRKFLCVSPDCLKLSELVMLIGNTSLTEEGIKGICDGLLGENVTCSVLVDLSQLGYR